MAAAALALAAHIKDHIVRIENLLKGLHRTTALRTGVAVDLRKAGDDLDLIGTDTECGELALPLADQLIRYDKERVLGAARSGGGNRGAGLPQAHVVGEQEAVLWEIGGKVGEGEPVKVLVAKTGARESGRPLCDELWLRRSNPLLIVNPCPRHLTPPRCFLLSSVYYGWVPAHKRSGRPSRPGRRLEGASQGVDHRRGRLDQPE